MASAPPGTLAAAIETAQALLASDAPEAERQARAIAKAAPNDPRPRLVLGSALRRQRAYAQARDVLAPLAQAYPDAALTQYELGLAYSGLGEAAAATTALQRATALKPDLAEAWRALGDELFRAGDAGGAEAAFREYERAAVRHPALRPAADALHVGDAQRAEALLRAHLRQRPGDGQALQMLAQACERLGRRDEARGLLEACLAAEPDSDAARFQLADLLFQMQEAAAAIPHLRALVAADPDEPAYLNLQAACLGMLGDYDQAIAIYERLLEAYPQHPRIWLNYGHALRTVGRRGDAVTAYRTCVALAPGLGDAYWSLANLKAGAVDAALEAAMAGQLARSDLADEDRLHLHYALGKALEDRGDAAGAFGNYASGAALRRNGLRYDADQTTALSRRSMALFTRDFFDARAGAGSASDAPVFIVGLPRSGSTLVEQILASHSAVEGTMELPDIAILAQSLVRPDAPYPDVVARLDRDQLSALGEAYLERTRVQRKTGAAHFIDKMPNNFHHLGLIHLILPGAKIIDVRRHPLGAGFSAFKQHFAHGHAFSYDLADLGRYYRDYVELMALFDAVLPGRVHRVIYEDLVEDAEAQVRRLLAHCGLPFEDGCLRFYENARAVRTVSSEQVRRPIFREGLEQWRAYEPWLGPLKAALGPALETWRG